jgi:hypothetical protein
MELIKTTVQHLPVQSLISWKNNPKERTTWNSSLKKLKIAVEQTKHIQALLILSFAGKMDKKFVVLDGNRRLEVAKSLNIGNLKCEIIDSADIKISEEEFFSYYNTSLSVGEKSKQYIYKITRNEKVLLKSQITALRHIQKCGGVELVDRLIDSRRSLKTDYALVSMIIKHCKKNFLDMEVCKTVYEWMEYNSESTFAVKQLIYPSTKGRPMNPSTMWENIINNIPLTGK